MGPQTAAAKLGIDFSAAVAITNAFFKHFGQVKNWMQYVKR